MEDGVYQHFRKEEHEIVDYFRSKICDVEVGYIPFLTGFVNPREQFIAKTLVGKKSSVQIAMKGGYNNADRKRILFYPSYLKPNIDDFEMQLLEIYYPVKFSEIYHRQILGALMHSGLQRSVIGDILTDGTRWQLIADQKISRFIVDQIHEVGSVKIKIKLKQFDQLIDPKSAWKQKCYLVSSKRVDSLIAKGFCLSRNKAKELINNSKVQVNWMTINRPDYQIHDKDIITVRELGRLRLDEKIGMTRKDKYKVKMSLIHV